MNTLVRPIRIVIATVGGLMMLLASMLVAAPQSQAAPYCGLYWGSLAKSGGMQMSSAQITNARVGRHTCYDRLVIDLNGPVKGFQVSYV